MVVKLKTILLQTEGPWGSVRCAQVPFTCVQLVNKIVVTPVTLGVTFGGQCIEEALTLSVDTSGDRSFSLSSKLKLGSLALIAMLTSVGVTSNKPTLSVLAKMPSEMVLSSCLPTSRMHVFSEAHLH